jgi:ketosteroid isomerase-like protein
MYYSAGVQESAHDATAASDDIEAQGEMSMNSSDIGGADAVAIRQLSQEIVDAANSQDLDRLMSFSHDDIIYLVPGRRPLEGWSAVKAHYDALHTRYRNEGRYLYLKAITHQVVVSGDWAWVYGETHVLMSPLGKTPIVPANAIPGSKHLSIYKRESGKWLRYRQIRNGNTPEMNI